VGSRRDVLASRPCHVHRARSISRHRVPWTYLRTCTKSTSRFRTRPVCGCRPSTLNLRPSKREDGLGDVVVMSYGPGFEVEARVIQVSDRSQLTWIGFASHHAKSPNVPTLDSAAFEALRVSGQRAPIYSPMTVWRYSPYMINDDPVPVCTAITFIYSQR
jgi:hypothetical protein